MAQIERAVPLNNTFYPHVPSEFNPERLHDPQRMIYNDETRIRVAACGRRFGKSTLGVTEALQACFPGGQGPGPQGEMPAEAGQPPPMDALCDPISRIVWWVSASLIQTRRVYRKLHAAFRAKEILDKKECMKFRLLQFKNLAILEFLSAGSGDRLRGEGLDFLVIDEAVDVPEHVWTSVLRPALIDRRGRALILGTPRGRHDWFHKIFLEGQDPPPQGQVRSFHFKSFDNPFLHPAECALTKNGMSAGNYASEIEAEFIDNHGAVFPNARRAVFTGKSVFKGDPGVRYATGIDLGRRRDATVVITLRLSPEGPAEMVSFKPLDNQNWVEQECFIRGYLDRFPGACFVDATGVGDPLYERMRHDHPWVDPYRFTEKSKYALIENLRVAFELERLRIFGEPRLLKELEQYEYDRYDGKTHPRHFPKYDAPPGEHDDCVIALALAYEAARKLGRPHGKNETSFLDEPCFFRDGFFAK